MDSARFNEILEQLIKQERKLGDTKGADYTIGDPDRLNNFKTVGSLVGCPHCQKPIGPRAVWAVYVLKHILALLAWVKTGKVESEGLEGRALDVRLYMPLGLGIAEEQQEQAKDARVTAATDEAVEKAWALAKTVAAQLRPAERRIGQKDRRVICDYRSSLGRRMCYWNTKAGARPGRRHDDGDCSGWLC